MQGRRQIAPSGGRYYRLSRGRSHTLPLHTRCAWLGQLGFARCCLLPYRPERRTARLCDLDRADAASRKAPPLQSAASTQRKKTTRVSTAQHNRSQTLSQFAYLESPAGNLSQQQPQVFPAWAEEVVFRQAIHGIARYNV